MTSHARGFFPPMMKRRAQSFYPMRPAYKSTIADAENREKSAKRFLSDMPTNNQKEIYFLHRELLQFYFFPNFWGDFKNLKPLGGL